MSFSPYEQGSQDTIPEVANGSYGGSKDCEVVDGGKEVGVESKGCRAGGAALGMGMGSSAGAGVGLGGVLHANDDPGVVICVRAGGDVMKADIESGLIMGGYISPATSTVTTCRYIRRKLSLVSPLGNIQCSQYFQYDLLQVIKGFPGTIARRSTAMKPPLSLG